MMINEIVHLEIYISFHDFDAPDGFLMKKDTVERNPPFLLHFIE